MFFPFNPGWVWRFFRGLVMKRLVAGLLSTSVSVVALLIAAPAQAQSQPAAAPDAAEDAETPSVVVTGSRF
ncbi:MAG: hypothetical protein C0474_09485, partial [Sphingobium sp.]|nr:hypothetical protein [Sphingobium sp.]